MNTTSRSMKSKTMATAIALLYVLLYVKPGSAQNTAAANQSRALEVVAELNFRPGNVAISKQGRVFATAHPLGENTFQLFEVNNSKTTTPFPSAAFQKNGGPATDGTLDTPLGLTFDKQDRLWVIDMGLTRGATRLWCFDIAQAKLLRVIELTQEIAPKGSFVQDLAIDEKNQWAYLADIASPGIIAINLNSEKARRFNKSKTLQPEDVDMIIDQKLVYFNGAPARVGVNPITLSDNRETLYFGSMNGKTWYEVPTALFRTAKDDATIEAAIHRNGKKPISDGVQTDVKGNHYFTNLTEHAISKRGKDGKLMNIIQDNRLNWPDNLALSASGYIYISVNQLNSTPAFTGGKDLGTAPYFIYRFKE